MCNYQKIYLILLNIVFLFSGGMVCAYSLCVYLF
jgi:hypothetical protein